MFSLSRKFPRINYILNVNLAKRLTEKQKGELKESFIKGENIDVLAQDYKCTKITIIRNLKKIIGETKFYSLSKNHETKKKLFSSKENVTNNIFDDTINAEVITENLNETKSDEINIEKDFTSSFIEITPLDCEIESSSRKDLSSIPVSESNLPEIVYLIVDANTELEIKFLKDYPEWDFLSADDLNRKTIEIFFDLKSAKRSCNKTQKVIKVPNTNVFKIAAPFLISKGISRIVSADALIAL